MKKTIIITVLFICTITAYADQRWQQCAVAPEEDSCSHTMGKLRAGGGLGSSAGFNIRMDYLAETFGVAISGGYWSQHYYGVSAELGLPIITTSFLRGDASLLLGVHTIPVVGSEDASGVFSRSTAQSFAGAAVTFHLSDFYIQAGLEYEFNAGPAAPQPLYQFGYLFEL